MANPALDYTPVPIHPVFGLHEWTQSWGSESRNIPIGYIENRKPRWQILKYSYEDPGALERFGVDPAHPAQGGVIMTADSYGYPLQGYTTGYSRKMPPSNIGMEAASQIPRSGMEMTVVGLSDGSGPPDQTPSSDIVYDINQLVRRGMAPLSGTPPSVAPPPGRPDVGGPVPKKSKGAKRIPRKPKDVVTHPDDDPVDGVGTLLDTGGL